MSMNHRAQIIQLRGDDNCAISTGSALIEWLGYFWSHGFWIRMIGSLQEPHKLRVLQNFQELQKKNQWQGRKIKIPNFQFSTFYEVGMAEFPYQYFDFLPLFPRNLQNPTESKGRLHSALLPISCSGHHHQQWFRRQNRRILQCGSPPGASTVEKCGLIDFYLCFSAPLLEFWWVETKFTFMGAKWWSWWVIVYREKEKECTRRRSAESRDRTMRVRSQNSYENFNNKGFQFSGIKENYVTKVRAQLGTS